jgi:hypothetical protein
VSPGQARPWLLRHRSLQGRDIVNRINAPIFQLIGERELATEARDAGFGAVVA